MRCFISRISQGIVNLLILLFFSSCGPYISYLGKSYPSTSTIDTYYDQNEVKQAYEVIGNLTHDLSGGYKTKDIEVEMIKKAKAIGADAVLFTDLETVRNEECLDCIVIKAKAIKYK